MVGDTHQHDRACSPSITKPGTDGRLVTRYFGLLLAPPKNGSQCLLWGGRFEHLEFRFVSAAGLGQMQSLANDYFGGSKLCPDWASDPWSVGV